MSFRSKKRTAELAELLKVSRPRLTSPTSEAEDELIIALDFGTTFSGIAWAITPDWKLQSIVEWPGYEGRTQPKVPTSISYDLANNQSFRWGEGGEKIKDKTKWTVIEAVKLLLDPEQPKPFYLPEAREDEANLDKVSKTAVDVASDYIGMMYQHALSVIRSKIPMEYVDQCQKKFVITVPAVWSEKAKDATQRAARKAGIYPVNIIKEPEAAALYTIHDNKHAFSENDAIVICDAGGGTVDLISYEIKKLAPNLELGELVPSKGGRAGSLGLNQRFVDAVRKIVGDQQFTSLKEKRGFEVAKAQFEREIKPAFKGDEEIDYLVHFPLAKLKNKPSKGLSANTWIMKSRDVKEIFEPLIEEIITLVGDQVKDVQLKRLNAQHANGDHVKAVFLVGGFGSSQYLKTRLQKKHPDIKITQPLDAWSAIMKGAVLSQLPKQASVVSYVAQKHYGVSAWSRWDGFEYEGQEIEWSDKYGEYRVHKMTWYIHKGEDLKRDRKVRFPFHRRLNRNYCDDDLILKSRLLETTQQVAPAYPHDHVTKVNATATSDLRGLEEKHIKRIIGADGKTYYDVHFDLTLTVGSALFKFALEIDGKEMGSVDVNYD